MPIEPKFVPDLFRGRSIMSKSVGLMIATVLAVGLVCAPASAQDSSDDDDDRGGVWIPILVFSGAAGTKSPQHGNFRTNPGRGGPRLLNPGLRQTASPWPGRRVIAGYAPNMRTRPLQLYPGGVKHVGLGRRF